MMRLWSIDPRILDQKGLGAAWREGLMAQSVICKLQAGQKPGYRNHPQLKRFLATDDPLAAIGTWLAGIRSEAARRGYKYNANLIKKPGDCRLSVTEGQMEYEFLHILKKLVVRSPDWYQFYYNLYTGGYDIDPHPMFDVIPGPVEDWEKNGKDKIGVLAKAALGALSQKATYQVDIDYAKQLLLEIVERTNDD